MRRSALIVLVPEAEPVVSALRKAHDPAAGQGVPAHVTILLPFMPADELDEKSIAEARELFSSEAGFAYRFESVTTFGDTTVYLEPSPAQAFVWLTRLSLRRWPEYPPYGGEFDEIVPHLSVGDRLRAGEAAPLIRQTRILLRRFGAISGRASAVNLFVEDDQGFWSSAAIFPLGGDPA